MKKNFYDVLEISRRASPEVIKAAYRALMLGFHPDRNKGRDGEAKLINEAFGILSDERKRADYDRVLKPNGNLIGGEYEILSKIASGGFGDTYKARHLLTGELVCVKHCSQVSPQHEEIFVRETKAMWDLRHYSIPLVRNLIKLEDGSLALVMSYIPGPTLDKIIEKNGPLDAETVAWIAERIINTLKYLHYSGVVHGDVKPQNVIVQPNRHTIVLVDFGLSLVRPTEDSKSNGFTEFFAPQEQIKNQPLLPESDFFSLGMTMLYALNGGAERVGRREVPVNTPDPLCDFIRKLIVLNILSRPNWQKEDLLESIQNVRKKSFGRLHSGMKSIPGFDDKDN